MDPGRIVDLKGLHGNIISVVAPVGFGFKEIGEWDLSFRSGRGLPNFAILVTAWMCGPRN